MSHEQSREAHGSGERREADPILGVALKWLIPKINFPMHQSDKGRTIELFKRLRDAGIHYSAEDVQDWLTGNMNWSLDLALQISSIAERVLNGKTFRGIPKGPYWEEDIVDQLKRDTEERTGHK